MPDLISVRNLYWRPATHAHNDILKDISLDFQKNDFLVLRGSSGSGKTVLLKILSGRIPSSSGILKYYDQDVNELRLKEIKGCIGYIPEEPLFLNSKNSYQNIEYVLKLQHTPREIIFDRIMHILKLTELMPKREVIASDLASSEKKILALAMTLAREVEILLCDFNLTGFSEEECVIRLLKNVTYRGTGVIVTAKKIADFKEVRAKYIDIINGEIK